MAGEPVAKGESADRVALDPAAAFTLVIIALAQSLLLYLAYEGATNDIAPFTDRLFLTLWYSLVVVPPGIVSLVLRAADDRYAWLSGLGVALVLLPLAWHTGIDCGNADWIRCEDVVVPYGFSLAIGFFVLLPFIQGWREHGRRIPYVVLFQNSWDNALTVAAAGAFTGGAWLILFLGAGLFKLVGIDFFMELITFAGFIYPVTGLLAGMGVVLARRQAGALHAVLRVCLALGRGLLPLISILALAFLGTLVFTGLQPLWDTKHATALLLLLIFGSVALVNAVLHDGTGVESTRPVLRRLMGAALLTLPVYATIAAIAMSLRIGQYGWTVDRLWGALLVFFAAAYSFAYASSVVVRGPRGWLSRLPQANTAVALVVAVTLLLTQSPLLDFRAITVSNQLARLDDGRTELAKFDFDYFRWDLGRPGYDALAALREDPRVIAAPEIAHKVKGVFEARQRWAAAGEIQLTLEDLRVVPQGQELPPGLLEAINGTTHYGSGNCRQVVCTLLAVDLGGDATPEWVLVDSANHWSLPVYGRHGERWRRLGTLRGEDLGDDKVLKALQAGQVQSVPPKWRDLEAAGRRLQVDDRN